MPSILSYIESTKSSPTTLYVGRIMSLSAEDEEGERVVEEKHQGSEYASQLAPSSGLQQRVSPATGQSDDPPGQQLPTPATTSISRSRTPSRPRTSHNDDDSDNDNALLCRRISSRRNLVLAVPDVPTIPARFLKTGRPASIASPAHLSPLQAASARDRHPSPTWYTVEPRPSTSAGDNPCRAATPRSLQRSSSLNGRRKDDRVAAAAAIAGTRESRPQARQDFNRRRSLPSITDVHRADALSRLESHTPLYNGVLDIARPTDGRSRNRDYFFEAADDKMADRDQVIQLRRSESRVSQGGKRRSFPANAQLDSSSDRRPNTSGNIHTTRPSHFTAHRRPTDLQRHVDQYRGGDSRASIQFADSASVSALSTSGAQRSFPALPDRSPVSPSRFRERFASPELPQYGRRRPSLGSAISNPRQHDLAQLTSETVDSREGSPTEGSEPKQTDSTSNESQTADTVWDELDDLKSRIKKLELTGKTPAMSSAAAAGELSDRPHTATTAPTTVDSSPKQDRKPTSSSKATPTPHTKEQTQPDRTPATDAMSNVHPTLHAALGKAKPLLNATLFSILEATATDALQLAAMTGSAGPQGTTFSAASIINGVTASDRHVRRKADTMCRNLTDLCLALCEGKYERPNVVTRPEVTTSPSVVISPLSEDTVAQDSPSLRHAGRDISRSASIARPMSRLEARRSSILGLHSLGDFESISPRGSVGDTSGSEQEHVPLQNYSVQPQRVSRAPRNFPSRLQFSDQEGRDDDPTIRPPSRAMTDIGVLKTRSRNTTEDRSPSFQRTPSLRESLSSRRKNDSALAHNQETPRVSSDPRRRRLFDHQNTPPVMEEEDSPSEYYTSSQLRRHITPSGQPSSRRATAAFGRSASLRQSRQAIVE